MGIPFWSFISLPKDFITHPPGTLSSARRLINFFGWSGSGRLAKVLIKQKRKRRNKDFVKQQKNQRRRQDPYNNDQEKHTNHKQILPPGAKQVRNN